MLSIRVEYEQDEDTWVATSPDLEENWIAVADSLEEARSMGEEGIRFVLERDDVSVVHLVTSPDATTHPHAA
jgi:predicted RNase H-like HicB family nuclease